MMRFSSGLAAVGLFVIQSLASAAAPNLVVFLCDDLSQRDISPYGNQEFRTPHMQALADSGLTFENAYVASPSCAPAAQPS